MRETTNALKGSSKNLYFFLATSQKRGKHKTSVFIG